MLANLARYGMPVPVDVLARRLRGLADFPDLYLCGPPAFLDAGIAAALAAGVPAERIHAERITAAGEPTG